MFIFIDNHNVIETERIISILDYQLIESSFQLRQLVNERKKVNKVTGDEKEAKSIIITDDHIYLSSLSTYTLKKREVLSSSISHLEKYEN